MKGGGAVLPASQQVDEGVLVHHAPQHTHKPAGRLWELSSQAVASWRCCQPILGLSQLTIRNDNRQNILSEY
jgi:hypothetical protein